jgi:hypothetical protein
MAVTLPSCINTSFRTQFKYRHCDNKHKKILTLNLIVVYLNCFIFQMKITPTTNRSPVTMIDNKGLTLEPLPVAVVLVALTVVLAAVLLLAAAGPVAVVILAVFYASSSSAAASASASSASTRLFKNFPPTDAPICSVGLA